MKRKAFTLIELLVVIAVIAILMGILLPAIGMVRTKAKESKARGEISAIVTALKQFESEYGKFPKVSGSPSTGDFELTPGKKKDGYYEMDDDYYELMDILTFSDHTDAGETPNDSSDQRKQNPRGIIFLEASTAYYSSDVKKNGFRDPWGRSYGILMDTDYDKVITLPNAARKNGDPDKLRTNVAVYSYGSNTVETPSSDEERNKVISSWSN